MNEIAPTSHDYLGNFTYLPIPKDGRLTGYALFAYGRGGSKKKDDDMAWQHVVQYLGPVQERNK